ncbi:hypothetical protein [Litorimonas cladophorae]|nr:hypothetical protein [Litorimonas cladophorae]
MDKTLNASVYKLALRNVEKFYHTSSRTHIYYQPHIGSLGVKGFGGFADEAYENYDSNLREILGRLSVEELSRSMQLIMDGPRGIEARREIQIRLPSDLKSKLRQNAEDNRTSMSDLIIELIDQAMPYTSDETEMVVWREKFSESMDVANKLKASSTVSSLVSVSVRLSEHRLEAIENVADSMDVRFSKLLAGIVTKQARDLVAA